MAEWQSTEHLGHTLSALRSTFAQAKRAAPCVLFVDELDGIGSRSNLGNHTLYWSQIVNLALTEITDLVESGGVLLVGATNHVEAIDPAVMRSGRFDRHVRIELPERDDVERILAHYLADDLAPDGEGDTDAAGDAAEPDGTVEASGAAGAVAGRDAETDRKPQPDDEADGTEHETEPERGPPGALAPPAAPASSPTPHRPEGGAR